MDYENYLAKPLFYWKVVKIKCENKIKSEFPDN